MACRCDGDAGQDGDKPHVSEPKKHHYIPVFYLKAWTNEEGKLCEFTRPYRDVTYKWRHPAATGYQKDLYSIPGLTGEEGLVIEKHYMGFVDTTAAKAHRKFLENGAEDLVNGERIAWSRFLYALVFRNPEHIASMNAQYRATAPDFIEEYRDRYDQIRRPSDPNTFDEFKTRFLSREHNMTALHAIPSMLQSRRVLGEIQSFHFWTATLGDFANPTFLTSDRPIIHDQRPQQGGNAHRHADLAPGTFHRGTRPVASRSVVEDAQHEVGQDGE